MGPTGRIPREERGLLLAQVWALSGTCARRRVGCVLVDAGGQQISSGYNGPAAGEPHCLENPCPGASCRSGEGLDLCEAIHAEQNALLRCHDVSKIHTCYVTAAPCIHCVKMLMGTSCERIIFAEDYPHSEASRRLWTNSPHRVWMQWSPDWRVQWLDPR